jgi:hypothetical protein
MLHNPNQPQEDCPSRAAWPRQSLSLISEVVCPSAGRTITEGIDSPRSISYWEPLRGGPMANKRILLVEPGYKNKYPPLGLMKIAQYHGRHGKGDHVRFIKGKDSSVEETAWDRIYITTLFSFEYRRISEAINYAMSLVRDQTQRIFVGGIAASLMHEHFLAEARWCGVRFIKGLLDRAPATALQLDEFDGDFYADDTHGTPIEDLIPDYSILEQTAYKYPVRDAYFAYASRGCIRKCHFCGVPKLEGSQRDATPLTELVRGVDDLYGAKRDLILMDNNVVASPRFKEIIAEIRDLGFLPGQKLQRPSERVASQRRVDFNQGVDARILCKDKMYLRELSSICLSPLRIAFDHLGLREPYERAVRFAHEFGLNNLSNYMLYNFQDSPADLFQRMLLNVRLNEELGIRIYSFPMRYQPTDLPDRSHVGPKWDRYFLRSVQIVLQATHGVVSGEPEFYKAAFGSSQNEFEQILSRPHHMIFHRHWYERHDGKTELHEFNKQFGKLSASEKAELLEFLSARNPAEYARDVGVLSRSLRRMARFYFPLTKARDAEIVELQRARIEGVGQNLPISLAAEEIVEDAGLEDEGYPAPKDAPTRRMFKQ